MKKVVTFWERLGVSGFRIDGAPFLIEETEPGTRGTCPATTASSPSCASASPGSAGMPCSSPRRTSPPRSCWSSSVSADGAASRVQMLFAFRLNEALMLSHWRARTSPPSRRR